MTADPRCVDIVESLIIGCPLDGAGSEATIRLATNRSKGVHTTLLDIPEGKAGELIANTVTIAVTRARVKAENSAVQLSAVGVPPPTPRRKSWGQWLNEWRCRIMGIQFRDEFYQPAYQPALPFIAGYMFVISMIFWIFIFNMGVYLFEWFMSWADSMYILQPAVTRWDPLQLMHIVVTGARLEYVPGTPHFATIRNFIFWFILGTSTYLSSLLYNKMSYMVPLEYALKDWMLLQTLIKLYNEKKVCPGVSHTILYDRFVVYKRDVEVTPNPTLPIIVGDLYQNATKVVVEHLGAPVFSQYIPTWYRSTSSAILKGVQERMYGGLSHDRGVSAEHAKWLKEFLTLELGSKIHPCERCHQYGGHYEAESAWNCSQGAWKRVSPAVAAIHNVAIIENLSGIAIGSTKVFMKDEAINAVSDGTTDFVDSAPRCICNPSAQEHAAIGPTTFTRAKALAREWNRNNWLYYVSGDQTIEVTEYLDVGHTYYVGDVSRFDRGLSYTMLKALDDWWGTFHTSSLARQVSKAQLKTRAYTQKGFHRFTFTGQRRSGDDNTSVDNSLLNIATHVWALAQSTGKTVAELRQVIKIMALGDDIVIQGPVWLETVDFKSLLRPLGWMIKPKTTTNINNVEFCSRLPWPSSYGRVFGGKLGRTLTRFGWNSHTNSRVDVGEKAYGLLLDNSHVPFVRPFLMRVLAVCGSPLFYKVVRPEWRMGGPECETYQPTQDTYDMLYDVYGLTLQDEQDFEAMLEKWYGGPCVMWHPSIAIMLQVEGLL